VFSIQGRTSRLIERVAGGGAVRRSAAERVRGSPVRFTCSTHDLERGRVAPQWDVEKSDLDILHALLITEVRRELRHVTDGDEQRYTT
jgi:hypothetical protein